MQGKAGFKAEFIQFLLTELVRFDKVEGWKGAFHG